MIKCIKTYKAVCDNCEAEYDESEMPEGLSDKDSALEAALNAGWIKVRGKMYCTNCCRHNDETDEYEPITL